ncbi:MAG: 3'-5' exonuclease [Ilumatobacteraceae bacterium]|nr:3'-5' exonuclease [Ilumatobacteraceae bacterium]
MPQSPASQSPSVEPPQPATSSLGFEEVFAHKLFAVIDFETTGLSPAIDRILQMAAVVVDIDGRIVDSFETVVKPEQPSEYTHGAEHVHGISADEVNNGMPLGLAMRRLQDISQNAVFTAHNARFDLGFLHAESTRIGQPWIITDYVDTLFLSRHLDPDKEHPHTLTHLIEKYGITRTVAHNALADARATAELLVVLLAQERQRQSQSADSDATK